MVKVNDKTIYSLHKVETPVETRIPGSQETICLYKLGLGVITPLYPTSPQNIQVDSGRLPVPGKKPVEAAVYSGFADYMGWKTGEVVEFMGNKIKIVGEFSYLGGYDALKGDPLTGAYTFPVLIIGLRDLEPFLENESRFTINLLSNYTVSQARAFGIITGIDSYALEEGLSVESILSLIPYEGVLPNPSIASVYNSSILAQTYMEMAKRTGVALSSFIPSTLDLYSTVSVESTLELSHGSRSDLVAIEGFIYEKIIDPLKRGLPENVSNTILFIGVSGVGAPPYTNEGPFLYRAEIHLDLHDIIYLSSPASPGMGGNIINLTLLSTTISVLFIGYFTFNSTVRLTLADLRRYFALLAARGAVTVRIKRKPS